MKKEKLIEELQKLPEGIDVFILDWRKNLGDDIGDGSSEGIYEDFEIALHSLEEDEAKYYKELHQKDFIPFISLSFSNDDYNDNGAKIE